MTERRDHRLILLALLLTFGIGVWLAGQFSLTHADAHQVWVTFPHSLPLLEDGAGSFARALMSDFAQAFQRAEQTPSVGLLQTAALNTWALLFDESEPMLRLLNILAGLLAVVALYRLIVHIGQNIALIGACALAIVLLFSLMMRINAMIEIALFLWSLALFMRWRSHGRQFVLFVMSVLMLLAAQAWLLLAIIGIYTLGSLLRLKWWRTASIMGVITLLLMLSANNFIENLATEPDWRAVAWQATQMRDPRSPAIYTLPDDHPLIYYNRQTNLLHGIAINIGWQTMSPDEISEIVSRIDSAPDVWAFTLQNDYGTLAHQIVAIDREITFEQQTGDVLIARYDKES